MGMYMAEIQFEWNESNTDHIARHGVTPVEAEEVIARHYGDLLRTELVEFEGMTLDFERKLPYLGSL